MANEIGISIALNVSKNGAVVSASGSKVLDLAGTEMIGAVQNFSTSESQINIGGCDSIQCIAIKNLDATNSLSIGLNTPITQLVSTIPAGGCILLANPPATLYGKSGAATVDAFICAVET